MKKLIIDNGNGDKRAIRLTTLIFTLLALLFGTNLIGGLIADKIRSAVLGKDVSLIQAQTERNTKSISENTSAITILQVKLEALDKGQDEIKELIMKNNK